MQAGEYGSTLLICYFQKVVTSHNLVVERQYFSAYRKHQ